LDLEALGLSIWPIGKSGTAPAQPPPHRCRTLPLLLVQMGYGILCGLWVWCWGTDPWPGFPLISNIDCTAWWLWMMRQSIGCAIDWLLIPRY